MYLIFQLLCDALQLNHIGSRLSSFAFRVCNALLRLGLIEGLLLNLLIERLHILQLDRDAVRNFYTQALMWVRLHRHWGVQLKLLRSVAHWFLLQQ